MDDPEPKREGGRAARRASDTHQRLLQAALDVFNEQGFDGCAIEDITEKADVGKGTFYRHFHDKVAILAALIERAVSDLEVRITTPPAPNATLENKLADLVRTHVTLYRERKDLFLLLLQAQGIMASRKESLPELQPALSRYWTLIETHLSSSSQPEAAPVNSRLLASAAAGSVLGVIMTGLSALPGNVLDEQLDALCNACVAGISQHLR